MTDVEEAIEALRDIEAKAGPEWRDRAYQKRQRLEEVAGDGV